MALSRGLGLPTTFYFALWRVRQYAPKKCHAMGHRRHPTLKLMPVLILPLPAGTGYYTRNVQISEDNVLSLSQLFSVSTFQRFSISERTLKLGQSRVLRVALGDLRLRPVQGPVEAE